MQSQNRGSIVLVRATAFMLAAMLGVLYPTTAYATGAQPVEANGTAVQLTGAAIAPKVGMMAGQADDALASDASGSTDDASSAMTDAFADTSAATTSTTGAAASSAASSAESYGRSAGAPHTLGGWSAAIVLTSSMQSVIPKDSLIVTMPVTADQLSVGDDITYMTGPDTSITHRILNVRPNYNGEGRTAFITKGVDNAQPDAMPVMEDNVVGKVVFHSYPLGVVAIFIRENWPLGLFLIVLAVLCRKAVRRINRTPASSGRRIREDLAQKLPVPQPQPAPPMTYGMKQPHMHTHACTTAQPPHGPAPCMQPRSYAAGPYARPALAI